MGRKKLSMSEKIRRYAAANPKAKPKDVALVLNVKPSLVYAVRYKKTNNVSPAVPKAKPVDIDAAYKLPLQLTLPLQPKVDMVNQPPHYKDGGIETIDFLQAKLSREEFIGYLKGNVLKYGSRLGKKGSVDIDAGKLSWYAIKLRDVLSVTQ